MRGTGTDIDPELASLTRELHPQLVGTLALYTGDRHLAEDLAQESLIRLHQHWPKVRSHPSPAAWTTRVALNLAGSWWRRRGAEGRANRRAGSGTAAAPADPADVLALRTAVTALPDRQRAVIVVRFYLGFSVREAAEALACPEGTVKSLTSSAVAALRRQIGGLDEPTEPPEPPEPPATIPMETFHV